jgi:hypothetical protein
MRSVLTTGDVARVCEVAPRTVAKWFDRGDLKGWKIPGSPDRRVPVQSLREFMARHGMPTAELDRLVYLTVLAIEVPTEVLDELRRRLPESQGWRIVSGQLGFEAGVYAATARPDLVVTLAEGETAADLAERIVAETAKARKRG